MRKNQKNRACRKKIKPMRRQYEAVLALAMSAVPPMGTLRVRDIPDMKGSPGDDNDDENGDEPIFRDKTGYEATSKNNGPT